MKTLTYRLLLVMLLLLGVTLVPAQAEDVDLFVGTPAVSTDMPNVLIVMDNTANWSTAFADEKTALTSVLGALPVNRFRIGLMFYTESPPSGGYVRAAIRNFNTANQTAYVNLFNDLSNTNPNSDKASGRALGLAMSEAYLYFSASTALNGDHDTKRDYTGNAITPAAAYAASNAIYALGDNAFTSSASHQYVSPIVSGCAKNFIIYIGNTTSNGNVTQDNNADNNAATTKLTAVGGNTSGISLNPSGFQDNVADEWSRFMKKSSYGITTYSVDVSQGTNANGPANSALLKSMATISGGKYFYITGGSQATQVGDALKAIFSEIQSVNSVFASVSLPISANTQGSYLNQIFIGQFRPDQDAYPRWTGNLKQYQLKYDSSAQTLNLADADNVLAINSSTGFITSCARSFWTPTTADTYWAFKPLGDCATDPGGVSNTPDGNIVEKGGQGYVLRSAANSTGRNMKTCDGSSATSCTALINFDTATTNATLTAALNTAVDTTANQINWVRGTDTQNEDIDLSTTEMRPSVHGDVVHSRPVAINYGGTGVAPSPPPSVVVYYGGNDGELRAINGNQTAAANTAVTNATGPASSTAALAVAATSAGSELWSFMPPEFYGNISRLYSNSPTISFPGTLVTTPTPTPKPYGFDGALSSYRNTAGTTTWLFGGLRRGGRSLYAFDVSSPTSPSLKWKKGCPNMGNDTGCSDYVASPLNPGFTGLGQTWATAKPVKAAYDTTKILLLMGGGYDACQDNDTPAGGTCTSSSKGGHVYVLDASNGSILKDLDTGTGQGIIADVTVVPDTSGNIIYGYTADLGGNVYRISATAGAPINTVDPSTWVITKIAALGGSGTSARKFMFAPDVVYDSGTYYLTLGSGDREKPLSYYSGAYAVNNYFFMIKDVPTSSSGVIGLSSLTFVPSPTTPTTITGSGWYLGLNRTVDLATEPSSHEQVVTSSIVVYGTVTFSTHTPAVPVVGACSNLGTARVCNLDYKTGQGTCGLVAGGGLAPSPVAGLVTVSYTDPVTGLTSTITVPFVIGANPNSPLESVIPPSGTTTSQSKGKVYWNLEQQ